MEPVSPYLQRPLRGMREACFEICRVRGEPPPHCRGCLFEDRCMAEARHLRRKQKKDTLERVWGRARRWDRTGTGEFPSGEIALYSW